MIKIKLEKNKREELIFKLSLKDEDIKTNNILKRVIFESKKVKGEYNYKVPMRFFEIILKTIKEKEVDKDSIMSFLEFSDAYDDKYYYKTEANASYMKKWREEGCPNIYKVEIDKDTLKINKKLAFKRIKNK